MKAKRTGTWAMTATATAAVAVLVVCRSAAVEAAYPVERARLMFSRTVWARVRGAWQGAGAAVENVRLRREISSLAVLRSDLDRLELENARLRAALGYVNRSSGRWMAAAVLSSGGGAAVVGRTIRVDKGSLSGVREGAVVVVPDGVVGLVESVTPHTANVMLVTDRRVKVACEVETAAEVKPRGIIVGGGEDVLVMRHLRNSEGMSPCSRVVTSGLGGVFPRGLEIGTLRDVREGEDGLACEGEVLPSVDYSSLEDVFVRRED